MADTRRTTSPALIAAAWLVVLVPAGWGLTFTVQNGVKIFSTGTQPASAPPSPAPAAPAK